MVVQSASPLSSSSSASSKPQTKGSQELGKDQFLRLMMTQMQNQDPTAPMDNQQMIAQMAQFSTLEIMQRTDQTMSAMLMAQAAANQQSAINLIGKNVVTNADTLDLNADTQAQTVSMQLPQKTSALNVVIVDENGNEVRHINAGVQEAGPFSVSWDGRDDHGTRLPEGKYSVRINAIDSTGETMNVLPQRVFPVESIIFENGIARIKSGDTTLSMSDVIEVR